MQLLTAVVANGERPQFPSHCPPAYSALALDCMDGDYTLRPTMAVVVSRLSAMRSPGGDLLAETLSVPRAVVRSEAMRMMRVMSMGGADVWGLDWEICGR